MHATDFTLHSTQPKGLSQNCKWGSMDGGWFLKLSCTSRHRLDTRVCSRNCSALNTGKYWDFRLTGDGERKRACSIMHISPSIPFLPGTLLLFIQIQIKSFFLNEPSKLSQVKNCTPQCFQKTLTTQFILCFCLLPKKL